MANFGVVSEWHHVDCTKELDKFRDVLKKGDIVQIKFMDHWYIWAVCTSEGHEPKMAHRFGANFVFLSRPVHYKKGSVHGLDELATPNSIRINNARDRMSAPKPVEDVVRSALEAVARKDFEGYCQLEFGLNNNTDFVEQVRYPKEALDNRLDVHGCTPWYAADQWESFSWLLMPGDMVEFNRKNVYSHWAVAVGRPLLTNKCRPLVHRYGAGKASEVVKKLIGMIMRSPFQEVIKGSRFRINNSRDKMHRPKDAADIKNFALDSVGSNAFGKYNLAFNNCWHFAMQARYRVKVSTNTEVCTKWCTSVEDLRPFLSTGDVIQLGNIKTCQPAQFKQLVIYVERDMSTATGKTTEVAHLWRPEEPHGKTVVRVTSAEDFFKDIARGRDFRIYNRYDCVWKPKVCEDIVKYIVRSDGNEDPYFVVGARYGKKARKEVETIGGDVSKALTDIIEQWRQPSEKWYLDNIA